MTFINAKQLAQYLGVTVSTVYNLMKIGELPESYKIGRSRRWDFDDIKKFIHEKKEQESWNSKKQNAVRQN